MHTTHPWQRITLQTARRTLSSSGPAGKLSTREILNIYSCDNFFASTHPRQMLMYRLSRIRRRSRSKGPGQNRRKSTNSWNEGAWLGLNNFKFWPANPWQWSVQGWVGRLVLLLQWRRCRFLRGSVGELRRCGQLGQGGGNGERRCRRGPSKMKMKACLWVPWPQHMQANWK